MSPLGNAIWRADELPCFLPGHEAHAVVQRKVSSMNETEQHKIQMDEDDVDSNGHLATALFIGVLVLLMVLIYAMANAA